jgi:hypothetical protein
MSHEILVHGHMNLLGHQESRKEKVNYNIKWNLTYLIK